MKKHMLYAAAVLLAGAMLTSGCSKDNERVYRLAYDQYHGATKTIIVDNQSMWEEGDQININGQGYISVEHNSNHWYVTAPDSINIDGGLYACYAGRGEMTNYDATNHAFTFTMPSTYEYGTGALMTPMVGVAEGKVINFEHTCALLKVNYTGEISGNIVLEENIENTYLAGSYTAYLGTDGLNITESASNSATSITITDVQNISRVDFVTTLYIPIPAGTHNLSITSTVNGETIRKSMTRDLEMEAGVVYVVNDSLTPWQPNHMGMFSVSPTKKVYFSSGNLQYRDGVWQFADSQDQTIATQNTTYRDLYFQSRDNDYRYGIGSSYLTNGANTGDYVGWNDLLPEWYVLTEAEWDYLLGTATPNRISDGKCTHSYAYAVVNYVVPAPGTAASVGVNGIILFPDNFDFSHWPAGVPVPASASYRGLGPYNVVWDNVPAHIVDGFYANGNMRYTASQWQVLENLGCAFLPATGHGDGNNNFANQDYGSAGYYWCDSDQQTRMKFTYNHIFQPGTGADNRHPSSGDQNFAYAVRLVKTAEITSAK